MEFIFSVKDEEQFNRYNLFKDLHSKKIYEFIDFLKTDFSVIDIPKYLVLANFETATEIIRNIEIPAYTNDTRIVITPDLEIWKQIMLKQLENYPDKSILTDIIDHYSNLNDNLIIQTIGHELAHQSEIFFDDFDQDLEQGIWFEEGMVEYISRKYFFSLPEYEKEKEINIRLVDLFESKYGSKSLEEFGQSTYEKDFCEIFYFYWKSFLTVENLLNKYGIIELLNLYKKWGNGDKKKSLEEYFEI